MLYYRAAWYYIKFTTYHCRSSPEISSISPRVSRKQHPLRPLWCPPVPRQSVKWSLITCFREDVKAFSEHNCTRRFRKEHLQISVWRVYGNLEFGTGISSSHSSVKPLSSSLGKTIDQRVHIHKQSSTQCVQIDQGNHFCSYISPWCVFPTEYLEHMDSTPNMTRDGSWHWNVLSSHRDTKLGDDSHRSNFKIWKTG